MKRALAALVIATIGLGAGATADHPDSVAQPLQDGCDRSQLILLGEAAVDLLHRSTIEVAPEWVYVGGAKGIRAIKSLEGRVLATHTAGQDLFGSHKSYDLNIDVAPDKGFESLLSTRNDRESPSQIHTEGEPAYIPTWVWPSPGDRLRETGSWIWDCGHWQEGNRNVPESDLLPLDPLAEAGVEHIGGEETEIHPISELATWRTLRGFVPPGEKASVPVSDLDVYISNQGGGAKAVEECALSPTDPSSQPQRVGQDAGCSELQDVTDRDYSYNLDAPPRPAPGATLHWATTDHGSHHAPKATVNVRANGITVRIPFSKVPRSSDVQDFGASYRVWWSKDAIRTHRFRVSLTRMRIFNNLDVDAGSEQQNPEVAQVSPNGEWNMYLDASGQWITLHDEIKRAGIGDLDSVPSATHAKPDVYGLAKLASREVDLTDDGAFRMFVDARECDLPGFIDCPADQELDFAQHPGRSEVVVPATKLAGTATTFTINAPMCKAGGGCPEEKSDPACKGACYDLAFTVTDLEASQTASHAIAGDGTAAGTTYDGIRASTLGWWTEPTTKPSLDQNEEAGFIRRAVVNAIANRRAVAKNSGITGGGGTAPEVSPPPAVESSSEPPLAEGSPVPLTRNAGVRWIAVIALLLVLGAAGAAGWRTLRRRTT